MSGDTWWQTVSEWKPDSYANANKIYKSPIILPDNFVNSNIPVAAICIHTRRKRECTICRGAGICMHGRRKTRCRFCKGGSLCSHEKERSKCKPCREAKLLAKLKAMENNEPNNLSNWGIK